MRSQQDVALETLDGFDSRYVAKLAESWITTADQLIAIAATPNGLTQLASLLNIPPTKMAQLLDLARVALAPSTVSRLEQPLDTSRLPLGARPTPKGRRS
jgi:hypothetical protein